MKVIAVTACTSGLAHTYLAKEKLEKAALELSIDLSVETQGAAGIQNELTELDIKNADVVLFATDVAISNSERFKDKDVYSIPINKVVRMPKEILESIRKKYKNE